MEKNDKFEAQATRASDGVLSKYHSHTPSVLVRAFSGADDYLEQTSDGLVGIFLSHNYTGAGLANGGLKGADKTLYDVLVHSKVCKDASCRLFFKMLFVGLWHSKVCKDDLCVKVVAPKHSR